MFLSVAEYSWVLRTDAQFCGAVRSVAECFLVLRNVS